MEEMAAVAVLALLAAVAVLVAVTLLSAVALLVAEETRMSGRRKASETTKWPVKASKNHRLI